MRKRSMKIGLYPMQKPICNFILYILSAIGECHPCAFPARHIIAVIAAIKSNMQSNAIMVISFSYKVSEIFHIPNFV